MKHRIAFAGFRHPHILALWRIVAAHPDCEIAGAWEADEATRAQLRSAGEISLTHERFEELLAPGVCDIVAVGDVYGKRGELLVAALRAGKHVISDKPICTSLSELDEIERLAKANHLSVGCQLDLVEAASIRQLRAIILSGELGRICTVTIGAQHALRLDSRAGWYFEPGVHGGTINDIGIHVFDLMPWLIGAPWEKLLIARTWNAKAERFPHFQDCAQFYALLENGATCYADVSYLAPDHLGFELPQYWRITVHGTRGVAETSYSSDSVVVTTDSDRTPRAISGEPAAPGRHLADFLSEIAGSPAQDGGLTTARVLNSSRWALETQKKAAQ